MGVARGVPVPWDELFDWTDPLGSVTEWVNGLLSEAVVALLKVPFDNALVNTGPARWNAATAMAGRWGAVMGLVAVAVAVVGVMAGAIARDTTRVLSAAGWAMVVWPITVACVWLAIQLTVVFDGLSVSILDSMSLGQGCTPEYSEWLMERGYPEDPCQADGAAVGTHALGLTLARVLAPMAAGGAPAGVSILILAVMLIGLLMLSLVMIMRSIGLVVAVGFAPVALMTMGWDKSRAMAGAWAKVVVALLLTQPMAAGIIWLTFELMGQANFEGDVASGLVAACGLLLAMLSPLLCMRLVSFITDGFGRAGTEGLEQASTQKVKQGVDTVKQQTVQVAKAGVAAAAGPAGGAALGAGGGVAGAAMNWVTNGQGADGEGASAAASSTSGSAPTGSSPTATTAAPGSQQGAASNAGSTPPQSATAAPAATLGTLPATNGTGQGDVSAHATAHAEAVAAGANPGASTPGAGGPGGPGTGGGGTGRSSGPGGGSPGAGTGSGAATADADVSVETPAGAPGRGTQSSPGGPAAVGPTGERDAPTAGESSGGQQGAPEQSTSGPRRAAPPAGGPGPSPQRSAPPGSSDEGAELF